MKYIEFFLEFYKSLNTPGLVLFWLIIVLFFFLFFSLIAVLLKNQELRKVIAKMKTNSEPKEQKIALVKDTHLQENVNKEPVIDIVIEKESLAEENKEVVLDKVEDSINDEIIEDIAFDIEKIEEEQKLEPIEIVESVTTEITEENDEESDKRNSFIEEISRQVEEELDDSLIELTEFENAQEEDAIISYEELLKNAKMAETRSERYNFDDSDDDNGFLNELKSFRNNL